MRLCPTRSLEDADPLIPEATIALTPPRPTPKMYRTLKFLRRDLHMEFITDAMIDQIIDQMEPEFDTHDFLQELMRRFPQAYTHELYRFESRPDPFRVLHPLIARALSSSQRLIQQGKTGSDNIRGRVTPNESWQRLD